MSVIIGKEKGPHYWVEVYECNHGTFFCVCKIEEDGSVTTMPGEHFDEATAKAEAKRLNEIDP